MKWWIQQFNKLWQKLLGVKHYDVPKIMQQINFEPLEVAPDIVIRLATYQDIQKLESLEKLTYHGYVAWSQQDFVNDWLYNPYAVYLVAFNQQQMVAAINGRIRYKSSHLSQLMVHPAFQQQGIGKILLEQWLNIARQLQTQQINLEVRQSNERAIQLYQSHDFKVVGQRERYYLDNNETAIIMSWAKGA